MSIQAMSWALRDAPVGADATSRLILMVLADYAKPDGCSAYPSVDTVSRLARVSTRCVRQHLRKLREAGVIRPGDQRILLHIRADRRPMVWDLCMPPTGETGMSQEREKVIDRELAKNDLNNHSLRNENKKQTYEVNKTSSRRTVNEMNTNSGRQTPRGEPQRRHGVNHCSPKPLDKPLLKPPIAPQGATNKQKTQSRTLIPADWQPDDKAHALAREYRLDIEGSAKKFRLWAESKGTRLVNWDKRFLLWLLQDMQKQDQPFRNNKSSLPSKSNEKQPHNHSPGCKHVQALLQPYHLSHKNTAGFGTSPWLQTASALADQLNQGISPKKALQVVHLLAKDLVDIT